MKKNIIKTKMMQGLSLLMMAAAFAACSNEDEPAGARQWRVNITADNGAAQTRSVAEPTEGELKTIWNADQPVEAYNESDEKVGSLEAEESTTTSTKINGAISGTYEVTNKLTLYTPSKTMDYSTQDGTLSRISAIDYMKAEVEITALDAESGVLTTTKANFTRLMAFVKVTFNTPLTKFTVKKGETLLTTVTCASGTDFWVALPADANTADYTFANADESLSVVMSGKKLVAGNYYNANITLAGQSSVATPPTAASLTYTGSAQQLIATAGTAANGTMQYSLDQSTWTADATAITGTGAGSYTVYYKAVGSGLYADSEVASIPVTIAKATISLTTAPTAKSGVDAGSNNAIVTAGAASAGTLMYKVDAGSWSSTVPTAEGLTGGNHTVYYYVKGDDNYNDLGSTGSPKGSVAVTLVTPMAESKALSSVTGSDVGWVIGSDGNAYHYIKDFTQLPTGVTAVAMIAYVGNGDSNGSYNKGLAIALADASTGVTWGTYGTDESDLSNMNTIALAKGDLAGIANTNYLKGKSYGVATAATNYGKTAPTGTSGWFLPSEGQWVLFVKACSPSTDWTSFNYGSGRAADFTNVNAKLSAVGGTQFTGDSTYWSSSEYNGYSALSVYFSRNNGVSVGGSLKNSSYRVRPFLAF